MNEDPSPPGVSVEIKLGEHPERLKVPEGTLSADLFEKVSPKWRSHVMVVINGRVAGPDVRLKQDDRVVVLPKMGGG